MGSSPGTTLYPSVCNEGCPWILRAPKAVAKAEPGYTLHGGYNIMRNKTSNVIFLFLVNNEFVTMIAEHTLICVRISVFGIDIPCHHGQRTIHFISITFSDPFSLLLLYVVSRDSSNLQYIHIFAFINSNQFKVLKNEENPTRAVNND